MGLHWFQDAYDATNPLADLHPDHQFHQEVAANEGSVATLAARFPGYSPESLANILHANGGNLQRTIEMVTQLEASISDSDNRDFCQAKNLFVVYMLI